MILTRKGVVMRRGLILTPEGKARLRELIRNMSSKDFAHVREMLYRFSRPEELERALAALNEALEG